MFTGGKGKGKAHQAHDGRNGWSAGLTDGRMGGREGLDGRQAAGQAEGTHDDLTSVQYIRGAFASIMDA